MFRVTWFSTVCLACALASSVAVHASFQDSALPLAERARTAERVVVGRVATVDAAWRVTDYGDRLIVSTLRVAVDETLKGPREPFVQVDVEGGTIGDLTLRVSDLESFVPGDRAVFYLRRGARGGFVPHRRGESLLKVDRFDRVHGSPLTLDDVRRSVAAGAAR